MRVLVTGANGFLGVSVVERLRARADLEVRALVRPGSARSRLEALQRECREGSLELFEGSLATAQAAAEALEGVEQVYHLAAGKSGPPAELVLNSVVSSRNLLEALLLRPAIPVVLVSSFGVYGVSGLPRGHTVTEETPLETHPELRDPYSFSKLRQEQLFWEYQERRPYPLSVLRPGVIYGPHGGGISNRVGLSLGPFFLFLGGNNLLPLTYVENCAEAIALAGTSQLAAGRAVNVVDDGLITCRQFLRHYQREVERLRPIRIPYWMLYRLAARLERYSVRSQGQIPPVLTPYKVAGSWGGNRFSNARLKSLGWEQRVPTDEGLRRTFAHLRSLGNADS